MKKYSKRIIALLVAVVMTVSLASSSVLGSSLVLASSSAFVSPVIKEAMEENVVKKGPTENKGSKELKSFTSTEELVASMNAELEKEPQKSTYDLNEKKEQEKLAASVEEKSGYTVQEVKSELKLAIFTERDKKTTDVSKLNLSKEELQSLTDEILAEENAVGLVDIKIKSDSNNVATKMTVDMDTGYEVGLDAIDEVSGVEELSPMVTKGSQIDKYSSGKNVSDGEAEIKTCENHVYKEPMFTWERVGDDSYSCTATFSCSECGKGIFTRKCDVIRENPQTFDYIASCEFQGKEYSDKKDFAANELTADWGAMCGFYAANTEYYGVSVEFWVSKNTETNPLGALKVLAGYEIDEEVPPVVLDQIISGLTQAFQAYVYYYGDALLQARDQALANLDENMTDLQKSLVIHDYISMTTTFDMSSLTAFQNGEASPDPIGMTPFAALLSNQVEGLSGCICLGYAATYTYLIQSAFPEYYRNQDGSFKTYDEIMEAGTDMIDMVMIKYDADPNEVSVAGPDSGFEGRFTEPHFYNALKLNNQWYYVDVCYDDIEPETISQYRVETDGTIYHMYFLFSQDTMEGWYEGYYEYIDTAHDNESEKPCNSDQYEDAWFTNVKSPIYYDNDYWYYVDSQTSYSEMFSQYGGNRDDADSAMVEQMMKQYDTPDYADQMKVRLRSNADDTSGEGITILIDYGYGKVTNLESKETIVNESLLADCKIDDAYFNIYPELNHSLGLRGNTIYFNLSNKIMMYDLKSSEVTQLKEYNDVYAATDGTEFTGSSYYAVGADSEEIEFHVVNPPVASMCIKEDDVMYVSIATNFTNSKNSRYKVESLNYNPYYYAYVKNKGEDVNTNVEFMWCANVKDNMKLSDIQSYLDGESEFKDVTIAPWCDTQGFAEARDVVSGCSDGRKKTNLTESIGHHYVYSEHEKAYICVRCNGDISEEDAEKEGVEKGHSYNTVPTFSWTQDEDGSYSCTVTFECSCASFTKTLECYVRSTSEAICTEDGNMVYTAICTLDGTEYTDTKSVMSPAKGHTYGNPEFEWVAENDSYTCTAIFSCINCEDKQSVSCEVDKVITDPTCDLGGSTVYTAKCTFRDKEYSDEKKIVIHAKGHEYNSPTFQWNEEDDTCVATAICNTCSEKKEVNCEVYSEVTEATCVNAGVKEYIATCDLEGKTYRDKKTEEILATGHTYEEPIFEWVEGSTNDYRCTAIFTCKKGDDEQKVDCKVEIEKTDPACEVNGAIVYTATCTFMDKDYSEKKEEVIAALGHNYEYKDNGDHTRTGICTRCGHEVTEKIVPSKPSNLKAVSLSYDSIQVTWDAIAGVDGYYVSHKTSDGWEDPVKVNTNKYLDTGLLCGTEYAYRVCAFNQKGTGEWSSDTVSAKPSLDTPTVKAVSSEYNSVKISWNKIAGANGYYVYRWNGKEWVRIQHITNEKTLSYTNTGLTCGTSYKFTVAAYRTVKGNAVSSGYNRNGVSATPTLATPTVKAASLGYNSVKISWNKIAGAKGYYVYRWNGKDWKKVKTITSGSTLSYNNTGLTCGTSYKFTVVAYRTEKGKTVCSSKNKKGVTAKPMLSTPSLKKATAGKKKITVQWGKVSGASGYYVYRKSGSSEYIKVKTITKNSIVSWTDSAVKSGAKYTYTIRAYRIVNGKNVLGNYKSSGISAKAK